TYSAPPTTRTAPTAAQPMERTATPTTPSPGMAAAGATAPGLSRGSSFASGLMGGLIGVGLGGLLFGHGLFGAGMTGFGSVLRLLLQVGLVVLAVTLLVRWFRRRQQPAMAGGPNIFARGQAPEAGPTARGFAGPAGPPPIKISEQDFNAFERLLQNVQAA